MKQWRRIGCVLAMACVTAGGIGARAGDKGKEKAPSNPMLDSGSFGVFIRGQRVLTESFTIQQQGSASTVRAQLKQTGSTGPEQTSELQLSTNGELVRYQWDDASAAKASLVVTPNNEFLIERITTAASEKPVEQPFLLPTSTMVLDNNFFIHREVLAWRYLAANCHQEKGSLQCQKEPAEFGVIVPQDRNSIRVRLELVGREKVNIRGTERDLVRLNLSGEGFSWAMWVDDHDQFKLMRILIAADNTEVIRD